MLKSNKPERAASRKSLPTRKTKEELLREIATLQESLAQAQANAKTAASPESPAQHNAWRVNEKRVQMILEANAIGIFEVDLQTGKVQWSETEFDLLGLQPGEASPDIERFFQLVHPEDREAAEKRVQWAIENHTQLDSEYRIVLPDGEIRWINALGKTVYDAEGQPARMIGICADITERKQIEEQLEDLSRFSSENPNPMMRISAEQKLLYFNDASKKQLRKWRCRVGKKVPQEIQEHISHALRTGKPSEIEVADGKRVLSLNIAPVRDGGYVNLYGRDITESRRISQAIEKSEAQLRHAMLLNRSFTFEWHIAKDKVIRAAECADILGLTKRAAIRDTSEGYFQKVVPEDREVLTGAIHKLTPKNNTYKITYRFLRPTGEIVFLEEIGRGIFNESGVLESVAGMTADVTERKKAEDLINQHIRLQRDTNSILNAALKCETEEELGSICLAIAEKATQSKFGFIGKINEKGLQELAISDPGWEACTITDTTGHNKQASNFKLHGIYGRVLLDGKGFFVNDPSKHPDSIGLPAGHPALTSFLGVPLIHEGKATGMVALGNREGGYTSDQLEIMEALAPSIVEAFNRKRAEEALRQSREDLDRAQEVGQIGSWRLDVGENVLTWSKANHRIFGIPEGETMSYETFVETIHPADRSYVDAQWQAALAGEPYDIEHRILVNGQIKWVREKAYLEFDKKGTLLGGFGITQDITSRKEVEISLARTLVEAENEKLLLEAVMDSLPTGVAITNLQGGNVKSNKEYERIWAGPRPPAFSVADYARYKAWWADTDEAIAPEEWASAIAVREDRSVLGQMLRIQRFDGSCAYVINSASPIKDSKGNLIGSVVAIQDITKQWQAEQSLRESEERLRLAIQAGNMATWDQHIPTGEIIWNAEHYQMLGYKVGEVTPSNEAMISRIHPEDQQIVAAAFADARKEGQEYRAEFRTCWPDGTIRWLWMLGDFNCDAAGRTVRSYGVLLDVTEMKENALRIEELNALLQEHVAKVDAANDELEWFSHSVSHDLRTPLRFMTMIAYGLLDERKKHQQDDIREQLQLIVQTTNDMATLIDNLLVFSRTNQKPLKRHVVDLEEMFHTVTKQLQQVNGEKQYEVRIQALPPCRGDEELLKQVAMNLLSNAFKFTRTRENPQITIGCNTTKTEIIYSVQDNGVGFDASKSTSLFVPFQRLHNPKEYEGTGIGLALTKRIIERHGGRIWAESEIDKGTMFYFTLGGSMGEIQGQTTH